MKRRTSPTFLVISLCVTVLGLLGFGNRARADEDDDLQRQIDTQKTGASDLEHLDSRHAASPELQRLRDWLSQAWDLRNKHEPDSAREVLDRCLAQGDLIRQIIAAAQIRADVSDREATLQKTKDKIAHQRKALLDAQMQKKVLEPKVGQ
jgi:hypothetical protein